MDINITLKECTLQVDGLIKPTFSDVFVTLTVFQFLGAFPSLNTLRVKKTQKNLNTHTKKKAAENLLPELWFGVAALTGQCEVIHCPVMGAD